MPNQWSLKRVLDWVILCSISLAPLVHELTLWAAVTSASILAGVYYLLRSQAERQAWRYHLHLVGIADAERSFYNTDLSRPRTEAPVAAPLPEVTSTPSRQGRRDFILN